MIENLNKNCNFEESLEKLDLLVKQIESNPMALNELLTLFKQGLELIQNCQTTLTEAQQQIHIMVNEQPQLYETPHNTDTDKTKD